jgi:MoaA/NifB/PqqE/SkfB family radical SAM enzyme
MFDLNDPEVAYAEETHEKILLVYWMLGTTCTYTCSYCPPKFHDGKFAYQPYDIILKTMEKLPPCHVMFTGGEATYHPEFEKIVHNAPSHIRVSVISNASRPVAFWERIVDRFKVVMLTFHAEFANLDRFFKTAELVYKESKRGGAINITMIPAHWDKCVEAYHRFIDAGMLVTVKPLVDNFGYQSSSVISDYSPEQLEWIKEKTNKNTNKNFATYNSKNELLFKTTPAEMLARNQTNFNGWTCYTPTQFLYINAAGDAYNTSCKQREHVGNIYTEFRLTSEPTICKQNFCWCYMDIMTKKVKNV